MTEQTPILKARNIRKSFGRNRVLKGIDLELFPGKTYAIVGENGTGKTTLLNILAGFWKQDEGIININCSMGFCPQSPYLFSNLTVKENLRLFELAYGLNYGSEEGKKSEYRESLIETFKLSDYGKYQCSILSEGIRQKLNLVISLLHDPDLLLLDEPYASFDWDTYLRFLDFSESLIQRGKTILIIAHFIYDKSKIDTVWEMKDGLLICN
jgi:ABC-type multidrug transport system ATPase subunit